MTSRSTQWMAQQLWNPERLTLIDARALRRGHEVYRMVANEFRPFGTVERIEQLDGGEVRVVYEERDAVTVRHSAQEWVMR